MCFALLAFTSPSRADDPRDIDGGTTATQPTKIVDLDAVTLLSPPAVVTPAAAATIPTGPGGVAGLEAENVDGKTSAEVRVRTRGLGADTYSVGVTKKSDHSVVVLGTFVIAPVTPPPAATARRSEGSDRQGSIEFSTGGKNPLPAGFDGFDVASLSVSDSKGNVVLGGDLTTTTSLVTRARLTPDASLPKASGFVSVFTSTRGGKTNSFFSLRAKGLPASAALTLALDGVDVQPAPTDATGHLRVRTLPATVDVSKIKTVAIHDATPTTLLSGSL